MTTLIVPASRLFCVWHDVPLLLLRHPLAPIAVVLNGKVEGNKTVVAWGANESGQTNVPLDLTNVVAIAAGQAHTLALKADGTISAWGYNYANETLVPPGTTNVLAIGAGAELSMAIVGQLKLSSVQVNGSDARVKFRTFAGQTYSVERSHDLRAETWTPLPGMPFIGAGGEASVTDTNSLSTQAAGFYRIKEGR